MRTCVVNHQFTRGSRRTGCMSVQEVELLRPSRPAKFLLPSRADWFLAAGMACDSPMFGTIVI
jgi:hypothetical protein